MKNTLLLIAMFVLPFCSLGQITLDYSNAPTVAQCQIPDTVDRVKKNTLPDVSPKVNATWDITSAKDSNIYSYYYNRPANSSVFPTATFVLPRQYVITTGLTYEFDAMKNVNNQGVITIGEHIERQGVPLAGLTGNTKDSLVFVKQDITYNVPDHKVKYPCTMGTKWTDNQVFSTKFNLTVTSSGLNNTPGERKTRRTIENEVTGWGKMRVNDHKGNPAVYEDVLVVDRKELTSDSFFLGGMPAPATLLVAFGLTQGQLVSKYLRSYYRAGEYVGLLEIEYEDAAFTKILDVRKHSQRLKPTSVSLIKKEKINISPNPVVNNKLTINVSSIKNGKVEYELYNTIGQKLLVGSIPENGVVELPDSIQEGVYYMNIIVNRNSIGVERISILK